MTVPSTSANSGGDGQPACAGCGGGATPVVDLQLLVPTRRPTPVFDLPTSTPEAVAAALPTNTPTARRPLLGTPSVVFGPDRVSWKLANARLCAGTCRTCGKSTTRTCP